MLGEMVMEDIYVNLKDLSYLLNKKHLNILFDHVSNNFLKFRIYDNKYEVIFKDNKYEVFKFEYPNNISHYITSTMGDVLNYVQ